MEAIIKTCTQLYLQQARSLATTNRGRVMTRTVLNTSFMVDLQIEQRLVQMVEPDFGCELARIRARGLSPIVQQF